MVANENPSDERLIALAEVRDVTPQLDEAGEMIGVPAIERTLAACLDGIRRVQTQRGAPATRKSATRLLSRRFAAVFVGGIGEDIADGGEVAGRMYVREGANVAVDRVGSVGA